MGGRGVNAAPAGRARTRRRSGMFDYGGGVEAVRHGMHGVLRMGAWLALVL